MTVIPKHDQNFKSPKSASMTLTSKHDQNFKVPEVQKNLLLPMGREITKVWRQNKSTLYTKIHNCLYIHSFRAFPCGSAGKESTCNVGDLGSIPGLGRSPGSRRERLPTPVFWSGEFHGLYIPWGRKESDAIEWLSLSHSFNYSAKKKFKGYTRV